MVSMNILTIIVCGSTAHLCLNCNDLHFSVLAFLVAATSRLRHVLLMSDVNLINFFIYISLARIAAMAHDDHKEFCAAVVEDAIAHVKKRKKVLLYLAGTHGSGKSSRAMCVRDTLIKRGYKAAAIWSGDTRVIPEAIVSKPPDGVNWSADAFDDAFVETITTCFKSCDIVIFFTCIYSNKRRAKIFDAVCTLNKKVRVFM